MKVLLISQIATVDYKYTYSLANALKECGVDVELIIDDKKDNGYCKCTCHNAFLTSRKDIGKFKKLTNYVSSYKLICDKAIKEHFDVVHVQWFQFSPVDYFYLKKLHKHGIKIVVSVHDILPFNQKFYDQSFHKKIYGMCSSIIVQAETNITRFTKLFPECTDAVKYIPHGNFADFAEFHDKSEARKHLGIPEDKTVFLFFGQIKKVKGVGVLLEAFSQLIKKRDDVYLAIAGNVWKDDFNEYQSIIDANGLSAKVLKTDIGFIPDKEVGYYYSACDIAVLPYIDVYQSGVVQLSYAYRKPVIATDIPAFREIVQDGYNGYICEANNPRSLESAMKRAADDSGDNRQNMGKNGDELIRSKFSWNTIAIQIKELYDKD